MKKEIRILILDDVASDVVVINHELRQAGFNFRSKRVDTREGFLYELQHSSKPDLILSDHGLPSFDGFTALAIAKDKCPDVPFIFVTGALGEEMTIQTFESGATDYVLKNRMSKLGPAVQRALREAEERAKRKGAEQALRESEERFRTLVEGVKDYAIFMLDPQGRVMSWNAGAEWITGYSAEEIMGQQFARFYPPEDVKQGRPDRAFQTVVEEGRFEEEGWRVRKSGEKFWASVVITALRNGNGKERLRGFVQVIRDITERKRVEEALHKSEERFRQLVELCSDALLVVLVDGQIVFANRAGINLLGATDPKQIVGKLMAEFLPPEHWETALERIRQLREQGPLAPFVEEQLSRPDGTRVDVEMSAVPLVFQDKLGMQVILRDITERKRAEEALRQSEARKGAMLATALDAIISIDHEGKVQEWNPASEKIFGYSRSDALGKRMDEVIIPPSLREIYREGLAEYLMTGVGSLLGRPIELTLRRADGTDFLAELAITRIPKVEPPVYTSFIRDITARKEAEQELRKSEARKSAILDTALDAVISINHQGVIQEWNPAAQRIFGYSRGEALGKEMADLIIPPSLRPAHRQGLARYLTTGEGRILGQRMEMTAQRAGGAEFPVELYIMRVPDSDPPVFTGFLRDITDRKQAEGALRQSEERFRLMIEGVTDYAIYMLDPEGRVTTWNAGAERIEGYRAEEVIGKHLSAFFTPEDVQHGMPQQALRRAEEDGRAVNEGWRVRKDGSRFWTQGILTALRDETGKLRGFSKVAHDITQQKEAEEETLRLNAELEQRVNDRTAELQATNKELEAFSYSISHDLRTPLRHIDGFIQILQESIASKLDEENHRTLETIAESSRQMGKLIDHLLEFSRLGRAELRKTSVNLAELVRGAQQDLRRDMAERQIEWVIGELPEVRGDSTLLRQVMVNLISNALKYTRSRTPAQIEIGCNESESEWVFFIRDNGVGFNMDYVHKLFGVFQRLHRVSEFEGTGIGLANVRRIIQRHGGRTWAEGVVDSGATFYFSLPKGNGGE